MAERKQYKASMYPGNTINKMRSSSKTPSRISTRSQLDRLFLSIFQQHPTLTVLLVLAMERAISIDARRALRQELLDLNDEFVLALPKVELHVHIEGTLTPELRWKFAQRNGQTLQLERTGTVYTSLEQLKESYGIIKPRPGHRIDNAEETFTFFEAYYGGFEVLVTERDFFDLAMHYFERAASMNVRYCEPFFDAQGHTRRGISWDTMMGGFRAAQEEAEKTLGVSRGDCSVFVMDNVLTRENRSSRAGSCAFCVICPPSRPWSTIRLSCRTGT